MGLSVIPWDVAFFGGYQGSEEPEKRDSRAIVRVDFWVEALIGV